ncbi:MAG: hypothetical protein KBD06_03615 [Candidatus Pacebacteria bacterium]|nr:hypothetical protein [Candidatus Paceibacterota bacterium]
MNKTTSVVGGIIIILLAVVIYMLAVRAPDSTIINAAATTTPNGEVTGTDAVVVADNEDVPGSAPDATTNAAYASTDTTSVVTGTVNPNGAATTYWYEYGVGTALGKQSPTQNVGSGRTATLAPGYITGLTKSTTYNYRLVAQNQYGKSTGPTLTLRTSSESAPVAGTIPTAKTFPANEITKASATLRGEVNPNKGTTQYWFEYGRTNRLGNTTAFVSVGNGSASIVATAEPKLNSNTTYYFRINAQNEYGTVNGAIMSFKTSR